MMIMAVYSEVLYMLDVTKGVLAHFTSDLSPLSSAAIGLASLVVAYWTARSAWLRWLTLRAHSPLPLFTRLLSGFVQAYSYDEEGFYGADGAPPEVQERRRRALEELKQRFDAQVSSPPSPPPATATATAIASTSATAAVRAHNSASHRCCPLPFATSQPAAVDTPWPPITLGRSAPRLRSSTSVFAS